MDALEDDGGRLGRVEKLMTTGEDEEGEGEGGREGEEREGLVERLIEGLLERSIGGREAMMMMMMVNLIQRKLVIFEMIKLFNCFS